MPGILRQLTVFGGRVLACATLIALLAPPFGLRAYLDARAQDQAASSQVLASFGRPAAAVVKVPVSVLSLIHI